MWRCEGEEVRVRREGGEIGGEVWRCEGEEVRVGRDEEVRV